MYIALFSSEGLGESVQTRLSLHCSHAQSIDADEDSGQDLLDMSAWAFVRDIFAYAICYKISCACPNQHFVTFCL